MALTEIPSPALPPALPGAPVTLSAPPPPKKPGGGGDQ